MSLGPEAQTQERVPDTSSGASRWRTARNVSAALVVGLTLAVFWVPLRMLFWFSLQEEQYSHILLVPVVSAFLFLRDRKRIFSNVETDWRAGPGMLVSGGLLNWLGHTYSVSSSENDQLFITTFSAVAMCVGGFILCYGLRAFRAAIFPLLFLFLMAPIPDVLLNPGHRLATARFGGSLLCGVPTGRCSRISNRVRLCFARGHDRNR